MRAKVLSFIIGTALAAGASANSGKSVAIAADAKFDEQLQKRNETLKESLKSLYRINRRLQTAVREKSRAEHEEQIAEAQLRQVAERLLATQVEERKIKSLLRNKLSSLSKVQNEAWWNYLLTAKNSAQFERNLKLLGLVSRRDLSLLKQYRDLQNDLKKEQRKFEERLALMKERQRTLMEREQTLRTQNNEKSSLVADLRKRQREALENLRQDRQKDPSSNLSESGVLDAVSRDSLLAKKGELEHPVRGMILRPYGLYRDNQDKVVFSHRGWTYDTNPGEPVRAVDTGKIAFVGRIPEYGQTVIVDHGDHYYSVYSGLLGASVANAQEVGAGTTLGWAGLLPYEDRSALYFEIRHFSETVDPKHWMKGRVYDITNFRPEE